MFFLPMSLQPQQRRRMQMAWLAATVGLTRLQKIEIIELNMVKLCGEITRFIQSNSSNPNKRFSLRLSTMLTHGTILLWNRQVKFCLDGALNCIMIIQEKQCEMMKPGLMESSADLQPKAVVRKPRVKKPIADKSHMDWEIDIQQATVEKMLSKEVSFNTRRLAEITLREDEPLRQQPDLEGDWFGEQQFPVLPRPGDQEPPTVARLPSPAIQLAEAAIQITERVEQPEQIPPSAAPEPVVVITRATLTSEDQEADKENQPPVPTIVTTEEPVGGQLLDTFKMPQVPVKKLRNIAKALYVKRGKPKVVSINRRMESYEDDVDYKELIKNWDVPLPTFECFENFWSAPMEGRDFASRELRSELHSISGPPDMRNIRSTSGSSLEVPSLATPSTIHETPVQDPSAMLSAGVIGSSVTPRKRPALMVETVIEDLPPAASEARTPTKKLRNVPITPRRRLASTERTRKDYPIVPSGIELEVPEQEQIRSQESSDFGVKWSERIMALVENFPRLTHEEICTHLKERLTKRNIATIFACLLALAKDRLVTLHSKPNSLEFGFVEKNIS